MAAVRELRHINITLGPGEVVESIVAGTQVQATEQGLTISTDKAYFEDYADLGAGPQGRVDAFVADVKTFIENQEPIV